MPSYIKLTFPDKNKIEELKLEISPTEESYWHKGKYVFTISVDTKNYPNVAPKCHCDTKIFHPNIDLEGHVCLNILR